MLWDFTELNYLAIIVAAIVRMVIAIIWYHKAVFGQTWVNDVLGGEKVVDLVVKKLYAFLNTYVVAVVIAGFISLVDDVSWWQGACVGFWAWLGFVATTTLSGVIWERKSWISFLLHNGEMLISYVVMGIIIAAF